MSFLAERSVVSRLRSYYMEQVPGRIGIAGDWHGNTAWATRAVRTDGRAAARTGPCSVRWCWLRFAGRPISNALRALISR